MSLRRSSRLSNGGVGDDATKISPAATGATEMPNGVLKKEAQRKSGQAAEAATAATAKAKAKDVKKVDPSMPPPVTPPRKRKIAETKSPSKPPPFTTTPSQMSFMNAPYSTGLPYSSGDIDGSSPPPSAKVPKVRPVEPHMSNAPLQTPRGSKVVANPLSRVGSMTTENLLDKACAHLLKVDPKLQTVIDRNYCYMFSPEGLQEQIDPFRALVSGICGQQVSGAAAKSIKNKFVALYNEGNEGKHVFPTPEQVAATDLARLRTAGLSGRKAEYIQGLAEKFASGELTARMLAEVSDEELMEKLIAVRGLGRWSVEMFACFALKRTDIFSTGDLGVQRGMAAYVGKDVAKLKAKGGGKWKYMSEKDMLDIAAPFEPYRSLFMWYMWKVEDVDIDVMQDA